MLIRTLMETLDSKVLFVPHRDCAPLEDNPRYIDKTDLFTLARSIAEFPQMLEKRPAICITGKDELYHPLGGNQRWHAYPLAVDYCKEKIRERDTAFPWQEHLALLERGFPIMLADGWSEEQRREFVIKDNINVGKWDMDKLANGWDVLELADWGLKVAQDIVKPEENAEDDFVLLQLTDVTTQLGDVYELNGHRIVCGDSTHTDPVSTLMQGQQAHLTFTSPPYWVGKDYETQKNEHEIDEFIQRITATMVFATQTDLGRIIINTGTSSIHRIDKKRKVEILLLLDKWQNALRDHGWLLRHLRFWVKRGQLPASISPKTDTIDQHNEYIGTFETHSELAQLGTFYDPVGDQRGQERIKTKWAQQGVWDDLPPWAHTDVWNDLHGEKAAGGRHKSEAAFPVELPGRNIRLYTKPGEIVFEPFLGSGTTMIACEQLERLCYGLELWPLNVDNAVMRWVKWMKGAGKPFTVKRNGVDITDHKWLYEDNYGTL